MTEPDTRVILVTGGASGIGLSTCRVFAQSGYKVAMVDMDQENLEKQTSWFTSRGGDICTVLCDVSCETDCRNAVAMVLEKFGRIDILFNNAGITQRSLFAHTRTEVFEKVMAVNFFGSLYMTQAALDALITSRGTIIVNESIAGVAPLLERTGYSASKHALHGLFTSLRCEMKSTGVHVMIVCPGFIKTNLQTRALGADGRVTHHPQTMIGKHQTPEFVAQKIRQGVEKKKSMLVLTFFGRLGYLISRLSPPLYEHLMTRRFQKTLQ
jgi:NAD(P)-dependent dehydrogenase (short-subunit alcohol dehydrogenase family)